MHSHFLRGIIATLRSQFGVQNIQNSWGRIAICYSKLSWLLLKIEFGLQISSSIYLLIFLI